MHHAELIQNVRQIVRDRFQELGLPVGSEVHESILVRDGFYCGRRFEFDHAQAIWFFDEHQIKLFDLDGTVADVLDIAPPPQAAQSRVA